MAETQSKSVFIEGDKSYFSSKGAVDRLKRDLKNVNFNIFVLKSYFNDMIIPKLIILFLFYCRDEYIL